MDQALTSYVMGFPKLLQQVEPLPGGTVSTLMKRPPLDAIFCVFFTVIGRLFFMFSSWFSIVVISFNFLGGCVVSSLVLFSFLWCLRKPPGVLVFPLLGGYS